MTWNQSFWLPALKHYEMIVKVVFRGYFGSRFGLAERTWCVWSELCRTSLARVGSSPSFISNDKQKRHKTNPHEKQRHQNELKQAPLCFAPGLEFYPHVPIWSLLLQSLKHKSQRHSHNHMTGTASGSERDAVCQFACMYWRTLVCVFVLPSSDPYDWVVAVTRSRLVSAHPPGGGEPKWTSSSGPPGWDGPPGWGDFMLQL